MLEGAVTNRKQAGRFSIRWDAARAEQAYAQGLWSPRSLGEALQLAAAEQPDRTILVDGDVRLTIKAVHEKAEHLARILVARLAPGSVVSFMLPNWHEAAVIYHAATLAGMVAHPILPSMRDHELLFQLNDVGSRLLFCPAQFRRHDYVAMFERISPEVTAGTELVIVRGEEDERSYTALLNADAAGVLPVVDPDAVRMVMYTSGTTGRPKGVLHTQNSLHALMQQLAQHWNVSPGDSFLVASPISHIGGSIYAFEAPVLLGSSAVLMERWEPTEALRLAAERRCTHMAGATPFLEQLLEAGVREQEHLPELKVFICGGASVPPSLIRRASAHFSNTAITRAYGATEVPVISVGCPRREDLDNAADTDGRPGIAEVRIVNASNAAQGEGEIVVRGAQMMVGYLHAEDEDSAFDEEGFYRTGDLGHFTADGCLVISGRSKDIIIRNGENIAPKEVEDMLLAHPQVDEIAIVGVPNARTGEHACAVVVPSNSQAPDVASLAAFLAARGVAAFKYPEEVVAAQSLPKNDAGKVLKHLIRNQLMRRGVQQ